MPNEKYSKSITAIITVCAEWHALAKLRMHTDITLELLERTTVKLGQEFRAFLCNVCSNIQTEELAAEVQARLRRLERQKAEKEKVEAKKAEEAGQSLGAEQGQKSTETTNGKRPGKGTKAKEDPSARGSKAKGARGTKAKQATVETIPAVDVPIVQSTVSSPSSILQPRD